MTTTYMATKNIKNDNFATPLWLMDIFRGYYDPCPLNKDFDIQKDKDGLIQNWEDYTYVNPPFSKITPWVIKAIEESKKGKVIIMLLRVDFNTKWFKLLMTAKAHILFFSERMCFNEDLKGSAFPYMLVIFNMKPKGPH